MQKIARVRLQDAESAYAATQRRVVEMVSLRYQSSGSDLPAVFTGVSLGDPRVGDLDGVAVLEQMAAERAAQPRTSRICAAVVPYLRARSAPMSAWW